MRPGAKPWTPVEVAELKRAYGRNGYEECRRVLPHRGRTVIWRKLKEINVTKQQRKEQLALIGLTIHQLYPGLLKQSVKNGDRVAELACELIRELRAIQTKELSHAG